MKRRAACWFLIILLASSGVGAIYIRSFAETGQVDSPQWATPTAKALKRVSSIWPAQHEPNFLNNTDCQLISYRLVNDDSMQNGCFTDTAFGMYSAESGLGIFNGTDEASPLIPYSAHEILVPWPDALNILALDSATTDGSYMTLYLNPLSALGDQRDLLGRLTAKVFKSPPDLPITDPSGQKIVINPQTLAFSDGGSWLVFESMAGSFVRMNLASMSMLPFAPAYGTSGSPGLLKSNVAISGGGQYAAVENSVADAFKVYRLENCPLATSTLRADNCPAYDYMPFIRQNIPGLQSIRHVRFVNDGLLSFEAVSSSSDLSGTYLLAPTDHITSLIDYLGLGDSFSSGEGAYDYQAGTDINDNHCHLSSQSYPLLLTHDLFSSTGGHSVACSGAVINDVGATGGKYRGQVAHVSDFQTLQSSEPALLQSIQTNFLPGYIAQQRFVRQYVPRIQTITIGGNDIGFGDMLERCVMFKLSLHTSDSTCYNTYEDRLEVLNLIDRTVSRWTTLYRELVAAAPGTHLYAVGYPEIAIDTGNCALNVHLAKSELEFAVELTRYLNDAISSAAIAAGISYVDISQALAGHRLCETASYNVAVNGLTAGNDAGLLGINFLGKESYHPNALGQHLIEEAILKQTAHFAVYAVQAKQTASRQTLLDRPKSGRKIATISPATLTTKRVKKGSAVQLNLSGAQNGTKPATAYEVKLDGPAGTTVGTITSGVNGDIAGTVIIPGDTSSGGHTIDVVGDNQAGELSDTTQPVYVDPTGSDVDQDGIDDATDSCPTVPNSGQDSDLDGIDDACDGFIGQMTSGNSQPPASTTNGSTASGMTSGASGASIVGAISSTPTEVKTFPLPAGAMSTNSLRGHVLGVNTANPQTSHRLQLQKITLGNKKLASPLPYISVRPALKLGLIAWALVACLIFVTSFLNDYLRRRPSSSLAASV